MMKSPTGKKVTHSRKSPMGQGSVRMPAAQPYPRINVPKDHHCKVCPGANRGR